MQQTLTLVENLHDILRGHQGFVASMAQSSDTAIDLIRRTRYWVHDPATGSFSPSKFVGYVNMTFQRYDSVRDGDPTEGAPFQGTLTRRAIEAIVGSYHPDAKLARALARWSSAHFGVHVLEGVDQAKWRFVALPSVDTAGGLLGLVGGWDGADELVDALAEVRRSSGRQPPELP